MFTGQNRFTRSLTGGYETMNGHRVYTSYSLGMEGEAIKESIVRKLAVKRVENSDGERFNHSAMSAVFIVLFTFLALFRLVICKIGCLQSDPHSHYLSMLALTCPLVEYFASHTPNLEQCASYRGSRQILSRRPYAPNKLCALNNDVRLIT